MDEIKEAFNKVKIEISSLEKEMFTLKESFFDLKEGIIEIGESLYYLTEKVEDLSLELNKTKEEKFYIPLNENPTENSFFKLGKGKISGISNGNDGVKTDRQIDRQTDKSYFLEEKKGELMNQNSFEEFSGLLDSLDELKKEIRLKFKRLTDQEMVVFSAIYQMGEEKGFSDYKSLSKRLSLTESSIRDYIRRLIFKGIPIEKKKLNNKEIQLFVSESLKKIASLSTILKLIDL